jgi:hypothetical protein
MANLHKEQRGSALTEAAIVIPCLVLVVYWSVALLDVLLLKLKAAEALRYALWESTVFKPPRQIHLEVLGRFADLRSPRRLGTQHTGLLLYPLARDLEWRADVDTTSAEGGLGGASLLPRTGGPWERFVDAVSAALGTSVDAAAAGMKFNTNGVALARVSLVHALHGAHSRILKGGDLPGLRGGSDLGLPRSVATLSFQAPLASQRPMRLVFDCWKAWPKPAPYTFATVSTDVAASPARTYPEVEKQVSGQVSAIAFIGINRLPAFRELREFVGRIFRFGVTKTVAGGTLPDIFSSDRMDDLATNRGPISILPPEQSTESWVPHRCEIAGKDLPCPTQRIGDVTGAAAVPIWLGDEHTIGDQVDRTRYTVPYRINTTYWKRSGGIDRELDSAQLERVKAKLATENEYVKSYRCRGHFFGGSRKAQVASSFGSCG